MSVKWFKISAAAVMALGLAAAPASAGTENLFGINPATAVTQELMSTGGQDSGWSATWDSSVNSQLNLTFKGISGNDFLIEKDATFNSNDMGGLEIVFQKTNSTTPYTLVINDETVINHTGLDWNGFNFALGTAANGDGSPGFAFSATDGSSGSLGSFQITPFTTFSFSNQDTVLSMGGGTVANGGVWLPGSTSQAGLAVVASGSLTSFVLKEIPVAIPLPAAAWTGLSTLLGLGFIGIARNARKLLA
jgi:hypothetical protein